jgi:hypothetical protein
MNDSELEKAMYEDFFMENPQIYRQYLDFKQKKLIAFRDGELDQATYRNNVLERLSSFDLDFEVEIERLKCSIEHAGDCRDDRALKYYQAELEDLLQERYLERNDSNILEP